MKIENAKMQTCKDCINFTRLENLIINKPNLETASVRNFDL